MTDLAVLMARPVEQGVLLGSALHRAGFPTVGPQGYKIGGDDPQHFGPEQLARGRAKAAQRIERAGEAEPLQWHGMLAGGLVSNDILNPTDELETSGVYAGGF